MQVKWESAPFIVLWVTPSSAGVSRCERRTWWRTAAVFRDMVFRPHSAQFREKHSESNSHSSFLKAPNAFCVMVKCTVQGAPYKVLCLRWGRGWCKNLVIFLPRLLFQWWHTKLIRMRKKNDFFSYLLVYKCGTTEKLFVFLIDSLRLKYTGMRHFSNAWMYCSTDDI